MRDYDSGRVLNTFGGTTIFLINASHSNTQLCSTLKSLPLVDGDQPLQRWWREGVMISAYVYVILVENPCAIGNESKVK